MPHHWGIRWVGKSKKQSQDDHPLTPMNSFFGFWLFSLNCITRVCLCMNHVHGNTREMDRTSYRAYFFLNWSFLDSYTQNTQYCTMQYNAFDLCYDFFELWQKDCADQKIQPIIHTSALSFFLLCLTPLHTLCHSLLYVIYMYTSILSFHCCHREEVLLCSQIPPSFSLSHESV